MVYKAGDKVRAVFQSACPRNNVRLESTFLTVERQDAEDAGKWDVVGCPACSASQLISRASERTNSESTVTGSPKPPPSLHLFIAYLAG